MLTGGAALPVQQPHSYISREWLPYTWVYPTLRQGWNQWIHPPIPYVSHQGIRAWLLLCRSPY